MPQSRNVKPESPKLNSETKIYAKLAQIKTESRVFKPKMGTDAMKQICTLDSAVSYTALNPSCQLQTPRSQQLQNIFLEYQNNFQRFNIFY